MAGLKPLKLPKITGYRLKGIRKKSSVLGKQKTLYLSKKPRSARS
jgi:hypothetical protein